MVKLAERFTLKLNPSSTPYSFHLTASAYSFSSMYDGQTLLLQLSSKPSSIALIREVGGVLEAKVYSERPLSVGDVEDELCFQLGLDEDLSDFYDKASSDPLLKSVGLKLRGMHLKCIPPWPAFMAALCQQNASFKQGWRLVHRLLSSLGSQTKVDGRLALLYPSPTKVVEAGLEILRSLGLGFRAKPLWEAAKYISDNLGPNEDVEVRHLQSLSSVKGVGEYTLRVALLFSARRYEPPPVDRWLVKVMSEAYGVRLKSVSEAETLLRSKWAGWGGLYAFFATIVTDAEPGEKAVERVRKGLVEPSFNFSLLTPMTMWRHL
ncbi:MAG: hypothetical protein DRJ97_05255 [Thermoprotei archaeon]|nr:MAG: hypothetical protein DRJ97_05255 [Thermoprotei archaeon]